jgi:hypothetical protein
MRLIPDDTWAILTIWQETRNEPDDVKLAVAEVIRDRTAKNYMSDGTVAGTVLHPYQFSGWNANDPNRILAAKGSTDDPHFLACRTAWERAQGGSAVAKGALFYLNEAPTIKLRGSLPEWFKDAEVLVRLGAYTFLEG